MSPSPRTFKIASVLAAAALLVAVAVAVTLWQRYPQSSGDAEGPRAAAPGASGRREPPAPPVPTAQVPLRYDVEYPFIGYSTAQRGDPIAELERRLAGGSARLELRPPRGYLDSLLEALDIDPASQALVFSTTSLQTGSIRPRTPRAIYFNDDVYVAWVQGGGPIEIASMDPELGPVFYVLENEQGAELEGQTERCLRCHDSFSLTGGGVPRFIVGSGYIGTLGNIVTHEGWILTSQRTPLRNRWGGWYVTGRHGEQKHLGNIVVRNVADLQDIDSLRIGNIDTLDDLVDTSVYAAPGSDIVALLLMQHQVDVQNEIARTSYKVRAALHEAEREGAAGETNEASDALRASIEELAEPLVEAMLFVGATPLTAPISGAADFRRRFENRGPADDQGRSLRELDLEQRLMRYPLSYLVHSAAFDALPSAAKEQVYSRLADVLRGAERDEKFAHLSDDDRAAVLEILAGTKPEFAAALAARPPAAVDTAAGAP
jgi:hypothetical protein